MRGFGNPGEFTLDGESGLNMYLRLRGYGGIKRIEANRLHTRSLTNIAPEKFTRYPKCK